MKNKHLSALVVSSLLVLCNGAGANPLGSAFKYQGQLQQSGSPVNGQYDVQFTLWDAVTNGTVVGATQTVAGASVSNGVFAVQLDFGDSVFNGDARWLELSVRPSGGTNDFTTLSPRQEIGATPYALLARTAGSVPVTNLFGTIGDSQLSMNVVLLNRGPIFTNTVTATNFCAPSLTSRTAGEALQVKATDGTGNGGALSLFAGNAGSASGGAGGNLNLQAGSAVPQGGVGYSGQEPASAVNIFSGAGYNGVGGNVTIKSGPNSPWSLTGNGFSKVSLQGGTLNSGDGAALDVEGGHNPASNGSSVSSGGNIWLTGGNATGGYAGGNIILNPGTGSPAGKVGIGTNNPAATLHVNGTTLATSMAAPSFTSRSPGESLLLKAVNGTGSGGALIINAGDAGSASGGAGGNLSLQAGSALPAGGSGYSGQGPAGNVSINAGGGYNGVGGSVTIASGPNSPWTLAGNSYSKVSLQGGTLNSGDGAAIDVEGGHNAAYGTSVSVGGNVRIAAGNASAGYAGGNIVLMPGTGSPAGNVGIGVTGPTYPLQMASGAYCSAAGVWTSVSDRNAKENFTTIDPREVLAKLATMPITSWKYKVDPDGINHLGPTAQDFRAAFGLGESEKAIGAVDETGVALAAIQGLNEIVSQQSAVLRAENEILSLKEKISELDSLTARLSALEKALNER